MPVLSRPPFDSEILAPLPMAPGKPVPPKRYMGDRWQRWMSMLQSLLTVAATRLAQVALTAQAATIAATSIPIADLASSNLRLRINVYARITRAATATSSLQVDVTWVDGGVVCTRTIGPETGNATTDYLADSVVIRADQNTLVEYSTTYGSTGATTMQHSLDISVEVVP